MNKGNLLTSANEWERKVVMEDLEKGRMSQKEASGRLGVMEWQVKGGAVLSMTTMLYRSRFSHHIICFSEISIDCH